MTIQSEWQFIIDDACNVRDFKWGVNDCCSWVNKIVFNFYGVDFLQKHNLIFKNKKQALQLIKDFCGEPNFRTATYKIAEQSGWEAIAPQSATIGCVGLIKAFDDFTLAICRGGVWVCRTKQGVACMPIDSATAVWVIKNG
jgi:hypothetical protein